MNSSKVFLRVNRVDAALCAEAREATVSDLHEAAASHGRGGLMSSRMRPIQKGAKIAGPAVTAFCAPGDNLMMHRALYLAQPGDVLVVVCDAETSGAQWGDMAARYAMRKGLAGVVVQGCVRDTDTVESLGCAVWATHIHSIHPDKSGHGFVNTPVVCDGVLVNPGDLIVADGDGVICVPKQEAAATVQAALARMRKEDALAKAVERGEAVWDLSGAAASYAAMKVEEIDAAFDDR
ncbi:MULTISPECIES: 4-carboxy-4-hydroxy-2-oxoadipate aldolase/oxaloacetate decarboxylase [unclassified Variovorax]|uniref:4-carboxy-4-hydroxy-2-oxoadipate aldolase/oxaloacetate decarboxylase n=1 Tax=unclassified Variovorax TaxID=663243 RepID=UPI00131984D6|nr:MULTISPECIES: 4-carboxy-4-hydroxy-2-oxoadipate aldolase/oxaloacetate decarboxylase [unclassified Variovorax]VTU15042.1 4-hydroxy-2-oxoglutarate aldolase [Variovorax sp. SRS16]VTU22463.1 4-hydroxy-2-oxoglutarate aldolase [Variovorax sp. PBL-E5]